MYDFVDCLVVPEDANGYKRYCISRCDFWWILGLCAFVGLVGGICAGVCIEREVRPVTVIVEDGMRMGTDSWTDAEGNEFCLDRYYERDHYQALLEIMTAMPCIVATNVRFKVSGRSRIVGYDPEKYAYRRRKMPRETRERERDLTIARVHAILNRVKW